MDFREQFLQHIDATPLPPLGDDRTRLTWEFTETDLNTIAFAVSFVQHALVSAPLPRLREHYGKALDNLAIRLARKSPENEPPKHFSAWQRLIWKFFRG